MPATRSTAPRTRSKQTRENVSPLASSSKKSFFHPSSSPENLQRARKPQQRERVASPPSDVEVIEISSDDDTPPRNTHDTMIADLRREITKLREESAKARRDSQRLSQELSQVREENKVFKAKQNPAVDKLVFDNSQISDHIECDICSSPMWSPWILDCGHSFCQNCLLDWFNTIHAKFVAENPGYDVNHPFQQAPHMQMLVQNMIHAPHVLRHPQIAGLLEMHMPPQPKYTCLTCREEVRTKPVEDFALKALVRTVAGATNQASPQKAAPPQTKKGKRAAAPPSGPWDKFFPMQVIQD